MYKARKLLFVAALVAPAAPAFADDTADAERAQAQWDDEALAAKASRGPVVYAMIDSKPYKIELGKAPVAVSQEEYGRWLGVTTPLLASNGRPACGNTLSKGPSQCQEALVAGVSARQQAIDARVTKAVAAKAAAARAAKRGGKH